MALMRNSGSAVDAIEIAIKVLEDREITNAGYGSNLAIDGVVECDAVVVDHFGRSGGAGAVARACTPEHISTVHLTNVNCRSQKPHIAGSPPARSHDADTLAPARTS